MFSRPREHVISAILRKTDSLQISDVENSRPFRPMDFDLPIESAVFIDDSISLW